MKTIASALLGFFTLALIGCGGSGGEDEHTLVVGMELAYPPFEMTNEQNEPAGISVEIAQALGQELGRPVRIENIPFAGLIPALKTGKIDLIISSMTATEERAQSIAFSDPYLSTGLCLLLPKEATISSIEDIVSSSRIAVKQGTTGHVYAMERLGSSDLLVFERESAAVLEVTQGKVDAFIYDQMSTYMNWQRHQGSTKPVLKPFQEESWAIGLRQGEDALLRQVNLFLSNYKESGGFERLGDQYLGEQKKAFQALGYPFYF